MIAAAIMTPAAPAQTPVEASAARFAKFDAWFQRYKSGAILYQISAGRAPAGCEVDVFGPGGRLHAALAECLASPSRAASQRLLEAATFYFSDDPAEESNKYDAQAPARVRDEALAALGMLRAGGAAEFLARDVLMDRTNCPTARRVAAARALGMIKDPATRLAVLAAASDPVPLVRAAAIESAVCLGGVQPATLCRWLGDPELDIRLAAIDAIAESVIHYKNDGDREAVLAPLRGLLGDPDWRIRLRAIEILAKAPARESIPALIAAMDRERSEIGNDRGRKRIVLKCGEALERITALGLPADDPAPWAKWWNTVYQHFQVGDQVAGRPGTAAVRDHYFTIPVKSGHMVFVIDVSRSMDEPCAAPPDTLRIVRPAQSGRWTRLDKAKNELIRVVRGLEDYDAFDIVAFSTSARAAFSALTKATKDMKKRAEKFISQLAPGGETALYDALSTALSTAGEPDTVFVLTDGEPTSGSATRPEELLRRLRIMNRAKAAEIHTIFPGASGSTGEALLKRIAMENRGEFRSIP
jgi:hypothetical protein